MAPTSISWLATTVILLFVTTSALQIPKRCNHRNRIVHWASGRNEEPGFAVNLEKPLGMILEEVEEGKPKGVTVTGLREEGSAFKSEFKDRFVGLQLVSVMGNCVENSAFDEVMEAIINAPSPVLLMFKDRSDTPSKPTIKFPVGSSVSITVLDGDKETVIDAKVGENLRAVLLANDVEVYKGLKQKLGNW